MLTLDVRPKHSIAHVRREARRYFGEQLGLDEGAAAGGSRMIFVGGGGYVTLEFSDGAADPSVLLHAREFEPQVREFARIIA